MAHVRNEAKLDLSEISLPRGLDCLTTQCWSRKDAPTQLRFAGYDLVDGPMFRLVIGDLILTSQREHFRGFRADFYADKQDVSGSIGFMGFFLDPNLNAVTVFLIGIEPKYQKQGFCGECFAYIERVADEFSMGVARATSVVNEDLVQMLLRRGYTRPLGTSRVYEKVLAKQDLGNLSSPPTSGEHTSPEHSE